MRAIPGWLMLGLMVPATTHASQTDARDPGGRWTVALSRGATTLSGASRGRGPEGEPLEFVPHRAGLWGAAVGFGGRFLRGTLVLRSGEPGLRLRGVPLTDQGAGLVIVTENAFRLTALMGTLSIPVARLRGGPRLRFAAGAGVEWWAADAVPTRRVLVFETGAAIETAVIGPLLAQLEASLGYSPASPFRQADLPDGFSTRSMWRKALSGGLAVRF